MVHGLSCSEACGIFLLRGSSLCLLHWQADSSPLSTREALVLFLFCPHSRLPCASIMAQRLKRLPAMRETWVRSLSWEDLLEKEMAPHSSILAWRIPWTRSLVGYSRRVAKSRTRLSNFTSLHSRQLSGCGVKDLVSF